MSSLASVSALVVATAIYSSLAMENHQCYSPRLLSPKPGGATVSFVRGEHSVRIDCNTFTVWSVEVDARCRPVIIQQLYSIGGEGFAEGNSQIHN